MCTALCCAVGEGEGEGGGEVLCIPSSFFRTRSTAPEQPPQLMEMLKVYWWSDIVCVGVVLGGVREGSG
jgi:hypothetical protein